MCQHACGRANGGRFAFSGFFLVRKVFTGACRACTKSVQVQLCTKFQQAGYLDHSDQCHCQCRFHSGAGGHRPPNRGCPPKFSRPHKLWLSPPKISRTVDTPWSTDSHRKISKFDATRCQILRLECTKFDPHWGCAPDPVGGAYSAPRAP